MNARQFQLANRLIDVLERAILRGGGEGAGEIKSDLVQPLPKGKIEIVGDPYLSSDEDEAMTALLNTVLAEEATPKEPIKTKAEEEADRWLARLQEELAERERAAAEAKREQLEDTTDEG